jgi:flagellar hook-length control protein FliK
VIQITPQTELSPVQQPQNQESGAVESPKSKSEKNQIGVFAKILAGLTGRSPLTKTGTGVPAAGGENPDKVSLAEKTRKGARLDKAALTEKSETKKTLKNGSVKPESSPLELSEQGRDLFAIDRLTGQDAEKSLKANSRDKTEGLTADLRRLSRESGKMETAVQPDQVAGSQNGEKQSQTISATAFVAEKSAQNVNNGAEKTKNRINSAEISAQNGIVAAENQRTEAKKVVPAEKEGRNRVEEARNRRKNATFDVRDFRSNQQAAVAQQNGYVPVQTSFEARTPGEGGGKDIILELRLPHQGTETTSATNNWETKASQSLENMLARELHQNFNNDIVRHASVALRDGNEGTIRLALKPESLGNVKIHLELAENKIIGHIVVESEEALRAFEREISSLEKAFRDSGFDAANLEMSLAHDGRGAENQWQEAEASQFLTGDFAASRYDAAIEQGEMPLAFDVYQGTTAINVLA